MRMILRPAGEKPANFKLERLEQRYLFSTAASSAVVTAAASSLPARQVEFLNRGIVAMNKTSTSVYISWRLLATDPSGIAFNLYRSTNGGAPVKLNGSPLTATTDFTNTGVDETKSNAYFVKPVIGGVEQVASETFTIPANTPVQQYLNIPLSAPPVTPLPDGSTYTYNANDASTGDLDGDGQYEIVLKWDPSDSKDSSQDGFTGSTYFDAYKLDGTRLWRINLGQNVRAGAHYTQFIVYDLDGDGKAEVAMKTAPGTIDGQGHAVLLPGDNVTDDYRNATSGRVNSGPEYLTVFNGLTGAAMMTVPFKPDRVSTSTWGDDYGNRQDRILMAVAYLDGQRPSLVMGRGIFPGQNSGHAVRNEITAWDWRNGNLSMRWWFRADKNAGSFGLPDQNTAYVGQGNYEMQIADVDGDGKDEIIYGSMTVNSNGTPRYSTGLGHGDALAVSDMDPSRPGQEVYMPMEDPLTNGQIASNIHDASTGQVIFSTPAFADTTGAYPDVGRGNAFDIDPRYPGFETWNSYDGRIYNVDGTDIQAKPSNMFINFGIWWDADPMRELLNGTTISDWRITNGVGGRSNYISGPSGLTSNNSTKSTPCLVADLFGDWREEVIWRRSDNTALQIWTTTIPATNRIFTLMQDVQYRESVAWQNVGYNQPTATSYFLGAADSSGSFPPIPTPNVYAPGADLTPPTVTGSNFLYETSYAVTINFSELMNPATINDTDLVLHPLFDGYDRYPYTHVYDAVANRATFFFISPIPDGNYTATLAANSVADAAGNSNQDAYSFNVYALGADANRDRVVDISDLAILAMNWRQTGRTFSQGDFNYDSKVDAADLGILSSHWQSSIAAPAEPATPTSFFARAPRRTARVISLIE
jgi:rhamnogalacturonan endolyase